MADWLLDFASLTLRFVIPVSGAFFFLYYKALYGEKQKLKKQTLYFYRKTLTVPNFVTFFGIIFVLSGVYHHFAGQPVLTVVSFILAGVSDVLDGWLARALNQRSRLGEILDPIRDRALLAGALIIFIDVIDFDGFGLFFLVSLVFAEVGIAFIGLKYASVMRVHSVGKSRQAIHLFFVCLILLNKFDMVFWDYLVISGPRQESQILFIMALFSAFGFAVYLRRIKEAVF